MTLNKDPFRYKLVIGNKPIEGVTKFKYLGIDLYSGNNPIKDLKSCDNVRLAEKTHPD